jgi:hypothetical protein
MSSTANDLTQAAKNLFLDANRDRLALTKNGPNDVFRRISAALALDAEAQNDVMLYADIVDQRGYAGEQARDDFRNAIYVAICKCFLRIQRNGVLEDVSKLTPEAQEQQENIEIAAGQRTPRPVVAAPPPPKSVAEQLEDEVRRDWKFLGADKLKHKLNNRAYKATFDRMIAADQLGSVCTTLTDGGRL